MASTRQLLKDVREAMGSDHRVGLRNIKVEPGSSDGIIALDGEVPDVAEKRLALRHAAAVPGVVGIVDRLRVRAAERQSDDPLRDRVREVLAQEPALQLYEIHERTADGAETVRGALPEGRGWIEFAVQDGVVTLDGRVAGLEGKRLAGVLAWWLPGSRDVINGLAVEPPEADTDDALANAVRLVLERDRVVDHDHVHVGTHDAVVTLAGVVRNAEQRDGGARCLVRLRGR